MLKFITHSLNALFDITRRPRSRDVRVVRQGIHFEYINGQKPYQQH